MRNGFVCVYCPRPTFCDAALQSEWKSIQLMFFVTVPYNLVNNCDKKH